MLIIYPLYNVFRAAGLYLLAGAATFEVVRYAVILALIVWVALSKALRSHLAVLALLCLFVNPAIGGTLSTAEAEGLRTEIAAMTNAFEKGDAEALISKTYPAIANLVGGQEVFAQTARQAVEQLRQTGVKFLSAEVGAPTQTYPAGDEEVCFVPRVSVMEVQGKKVKSTTFMVAVRYVGARDWKYFDGAGLRQQPDLLYLLVPKLERGISLPLNTVELL